MRNCACAPRQPCACVAPLSAAVLHVCGGPAVRPTRAVSAGRTGCSFPGQCETGGCGGKEQCDGAGGAPPTTLVEMNLNTKTGEPRRAAGQGVRARVAACARGVAGACVRSVWPEGRVCAGGARRVSPAAYRQAPRLRLPRVACCTALRHAHAHAAGGLDFYDVSLVNGYNLPMAVRPRPQARTIPQAASLGTDRASEPPWPRPCCTLLHAAARGPTAGPATPGRLGDAPSRPSEASGYSSHSSLR